jgi:hypothetical protein
MRMHIGQTKSALAPALTASFLASGGIQPYVYSIAPNGAGGSIDQGGFYTAPAVAPTNPAQLFDTIIATDQTGKSVSSQILVGDTLTLFCEILQRELGLANDRIYIYNQKIFQPTDTGLYIAIGVLRAKPFSNNQSSNNGIESQVTNFMTTLEINAISRDTSALTRKEEILMALNSQYSESQQEANSFLIGRLPPGAQFINLSAIDGAAIPYRFNISVNVQYAATKTKPAPYFNTFLPFQETINP